ncbi:hypothetical protein [Borrelia sp. RT5S]|nr:hypothetical protein [Borrelia sp. RT5S]UGQ16645.1 hypothetical protein LSO06_04840 [Borrelia sp. RT5S]
MPRRNTRKENISTNDLHENIINEKTYKLKRNERAKAFLQNIKSNRIL